MSETDTTTQTEAELATNAEAELADFLAVKRPSFKEVVYKGKKYALVMPPGEMIEKIVALTSQNVMRQAKGSKVPEQVSRHNARKREAWALVTTLHVFNPNTKEPAAKVFFKNEAEAVEKLMLQPYEADGLLNVVGSKAVSMLFETSLSEEVTAAGNA